MYMINDQRSLLLWEGAAWKQSFNWVYCAFVSDCIFVSFPSFEILRTYFEIYNDHIYTVIKSVLLRNCSWFNIKWLSAVLSTYHSYIRPIYAVLKRYIWAKHKNFNLRLFLSAKYIAASTLAYVCMSIIYVHNIIPVSVERV